jgi:phospholipid/cholesterol/gamma-HCH transport system substrate-binding protein
MPVTRNTAIGLGLTIVSLVLLAWSIAGKPDPFAKDHPIWAEFRDASTVIHFDRDVRLGGVNVGTIGAIERKGDLARVQLKLDPDVADAVRADATAELRPHTLFDGNSFIELHAGSRSAPPLGNATIPVSRTRNYVSLDKALRVLDSNTRRALQGLLHDAGRSLRDPQVKALRRTFTASPPLLRATRSWARAAQGPTRRELTGAITGFGRTAKAIAQAQRDLAPMLRDTGATTTALEGPGDSLERTLSALPGTLAEVDSGSVAVHAMLRRATPLAADLTPAMKELAPTLTELRPVLAKTAPVLRRTRPFAADLRSSLASAHRAAPPATEFLRRLRPVLVMAAERLVPFLRSKTATGANTAQALLATAASAAATLSPVKSLEEGSGPGNAGPGHGYYISTSSGNDHVGCATIPDPTISGQLKALGLCTP